MADQKFGRNGRAPSNANQARRTERNKRRHAENAHAMSMRQPEPGECFYGHPRKMDKAAKHFAACMSLQTARRARAHAIREAQQ